MKCGRYVKSVRPSEVNVGWGGETPMNADGGGEMNEKGERKMTDGPSGTLLLLLRDRALCHHCGE